MSEYDTFLKLKRIPYTEMYAIWAESLLLKNYNVAEWSEIEQLFEKYGWTVEEYSRYSLE